jgi:hypothetical protein
MEMVCQHCKKTIWSSKIKIKREKLDGKCFVCKKPVGWLNCYAIGYLGNKKRKYFCSENCMKKDGNK